MAKQLQINILGNVHITELIKIDYEDLYGTKTTTILNQNNEPLTKAHLAEEGDHFYTANEISRATKTDNTFTLTPKTAIDINTGQPKEKIPSSFDKIEAFSPTDTEYASNFETTDVYLLPNIQLKPGLFLKGEFNYNPTYQKKQALLTANQDGTFLLLGNVKSPAFIGIETDSQLLIAEEENQNIQNPEEDFNALF